MFSNLTFDQVFILWTVMLKYLSIVWNFHHFYKLQCYRIWFGEKKYITLFRNTIVLCLMNLPIVKCFKIFQLVIGLVHSVLDNDILPHNNEGFFPDQPFNLETISNILITARSIDFFGFRRILQKSSLVSRNSFVFFCPYFKTGSISVPDKCQLIYCRKNIENVLFSY